MPKPKSLILLAAACLALAACSLPRGAAVQSEVVREADAADPDFAVVAVTRDALPLLATWPGEAGTPTHWPHAGDGSLSAIIRVGDALDVTIWDSSENSLLTSANQRATRIDGIEVDGSGQVFLPYVEKVEVRGLTVDAARQRIQERLEPILPSAQAQVALVRGRGYAVDVVGGVAKPGAFPMPSSNYKILNVLADAGGIARGLRNPQVALMRGPTRYTIAADRLYDDPRFNALLYPRDAVIVEEDDRSFTALGASGTEDIIHFPKDRLSALEAVSLMGGLSDNRADPKGVLVLREYAPAAVRANGRGPAEPSVVFTLDLTTADGLFAARNFAVHPGDTVLATESPVGGAQTVLGLVGSVFGLTRQAAILSR